MRLSLPEIPKTLRWDHNAHYHDFLLQRLPRHMDRALDVGCGDGRFARLVAERAAHVDAIDASADMIAAARAQPDAVNVAWLLGDVMQHELEPASYDAVTAIASLHHLPLAPALDRLSQLVRPGGVLAVLGLAREDSAAGYALAAAAVPANIAIGVWRNIRGTIGHAPPGMPVRDPDETYGHVRAAVRQQLPAADIRRHLFFRYSLVWHRPTASPPG
jgi:SAM-dependent methyltransferase